MKPNILVILTDQQRWDAVGCYGNPMNLTPNLDLLARQGVKFKYSFSCQPICGPARSVLQTGIYPTENGCFINGIALRDSCKTIAHAIKEAGYDTAYIGKWHLAATKDKPVPVNLRGGYDFWLAADALEATSYPYGGIIYDSENNEVELKGYRVDAVTDLALNYLDRRDNRKPFFLFLSYLEPHHQNNMKRYVAPEGYSELYRQFYVPGDLINTEGDWDESLPDYYGMCKRIDENLGRICDKLKELKLFDETVILFTSDHGCHFRTRNAEYKRSCHESSIRIPLVVHGPGFKGGRIISKFVSQIDIAPTLIDIAGGEIPEYMKGNSLVKLVGGEKTDWPEEVFIQISGTQVGRALRTDRWKYCVYDPSKNPRTDMNSEKYIGLYLYDLENDPHEKNNLIGLPEYKDLCVELSERLKARMVQAGEREPVIIV